MINQQKTSTEPDAQREEASLDEPSKKGSMELEAKKKTTTE